MVDKKSSFIVFLETANAIYLVATSYVYIKHKESSHSVDISLDAAQILRDSTPAITFVSWELNKTSIAKYVTLVTQIQKIGSSFLCPQFDMHQLKHVPFPEKSFMNKYG